MPVKSWHEFLTAKGAKLSNEALQPTAEELELRRRLRDLSAYRRQLVEGVIEQFSLDDEIWNDKADPQ